MASVIAQQIFNTIMNHGKNLLILRAADSSPELWRIYQAIYDDFYGRSYSKLVLKDKKTGQIYGETSPEDLEAALAGLPADITVNFEGVRHDEHLLERDMQTRGALISKYNADGSLRATPLIRYSQAVFTTVEKAFADLMRKKYEEQRVKY